MFSDSLLVDIRTSVCYCLRQILLMCMIANATKALCMIECKNVIDEVE